MSMISPEKERVDFYRCVVVNEKEKKDQVEKWLIEVEEVMRQTLKYESKKLILDDRERLEQISNFPSMTLLCQIMIKWTR